MSVLFKSAGAAGIALRTPDGFEVNVNGSWEKRKVTGCGNCVIIPGPPNPPPPPPPHLSSRGSLSRYPTPHAPVDVRYTRCDSAHACWMLIGACNPMV